MSGALPVTSGPTVSVVVCYLNAAKFLAEALDSVLAQTMSDFEIVLVDDGSSDESSHIAASYAERDRRVICIHHRGHANLGLSVSRNAGIAAARSDVIALLDADDVWRPNKLADQLALLDAHPNAAMVCGATLYWRSWSGGEDRIVPTGSGRAELVLAPRAAYEFAPLGRQSAPCPSDLLLRRTAIEAVGGFEPSFRGNYEDQAFLFKLYLDFAVFVSDRVWLDYRRHDRSMSSTVNVDGTADPTRDYFFRWFASYVKAREGVDMRVIRAIRRERLLRRVRPLKRMIAPLLGDRGRAG